MSNVTLLIPLIETLSDREAILVAQCNLLIQRLEDALMTDPISAQLSEGDWWETALEVRDKRLHGEQTDHILKLETKLNDLSQYNHYLLEEKHRLERELSQCAINPSLSKQALQPSAMTNPHPYTVV